MIFIEGEKNYCVYMHINNVNNKKYIGITGQNPQKRWGKNGKGYPMDNQPAFRRAIEKYGWDNFEHIIIYSNLTKEEASEIEIKLIDEYDTQNPEFGYNIQAGGSLGNIGKKFSEESKLKMSLAHKGKTLSEEHKKHISESLYGHVGCVHTEEGIKKLHDANVGKVISEEIRNKISKALTGIKRSEETKEKIKNNNPFKKNVYCTELNMTFRSIAEAAKYVGTYRQNIQHVLKGERNCAGVHPITKEKLHWVLV